MNSTVIFDCPQELLLGLHYDAKQFAELAKTETALALFKAGKVSSGMAAVWLGVPRAHFLIHACSVGIELLDDSSDDYRREMAD